MTSSQPFSRLPVGHLGVQWAHRCRHHHQHHPGLARTLPLCEFWAHEHLLIENQVRGKVEHPGVDIGEGAPAHGEHHQAHPGVLNDCHLVIHVQVAEACSQGRERGRTERCRAASLWSSGGPRNCQCWGSGGEPSTWRCSVRPDLTELLK